MLTQKLLKECIIYDPKTGLFTWLKRPVYHFKDGKKHKAQSVCNNWNAIFSNKSAGSKTKKGYINIVLNNKSYRAHRLAWLYMEGYMPENLIDHIDQNPSNNKWDNLRHVSNICNSQNCKISKNNTSGVTGISFLKDNNKWLVRIKIHGKSKYLGRFKELEDAVWARYNEEQSNPDWKCSTISPAFKYLKENNLL